MAQVDCIGPMKIGMKIRRDSIALAAEALGKMFDKGEEDLVQQVKQGSHRLEKYLNIQDILEKSLKIKLKKTLKGLEKSLNFTAYRRIQHCLGRPKSV